VISYIQGTETLTLTRRGPISFVWINTTNARETGYEQREIWQEREQEGNEVKEENENTEWKGENSEKYNNMKDDKEE
jgi:hypothetical protein